MNHSINQQANKEEYNKNVNDMKARLLVGLLTVALGGLTSCSNILEENGVINNVAESGMGELRINLTTDASLNVSTKGGEIVDLTNTYSTLIPNFKVTLKARDGYSVDNLPTNQTYSDIVGITYKLPIEGNDYTLEAKYSSMNNQNFGWDTPEFSGSESIKLKSIERIDGKAICYLTNSLVTIDTNGLTSNNITVKTLALSIGEGENKETLYLMGDNVQQDKSLENNKVFIKANISPKIELSGTLNEGEGKSYNFTSTSNLIANSGKTEAKKQYQVAFNVSSAQGRLNLIIEINGQVTTQDITLPVDPYNPDTNTEQE